MNDQTYDANDTDLEVLVDNIKKALSIHTFVSMTPTDPDGDGHFTLDDMGVYGKIAGNGYVCLGKQYGSFTIQWGKISQPSISTDAGLNLSFPIAFRSGVTAIVGTDAGSGCYGLGFSNDSLTTFRTWSRNITTGSFSASTFFYIAFGI